MGQKAHSLGRGGIRYRSLEVMTESYAGLPPQPSAQGQTSIKDFLNSC